MRSAPDSVVSAAARVVGPVRSGLRALALTAWTAGLTQLTTGPLRMGAGPMRGAQMQRWVRRWARGLLRVFGVDARWGGAPSGPANRARLVVANHRSPLDIILMLERFGGSVLARHDLERWPVLGRAAREGGTIFVDRDDPNSGLKAIREIRRRLREGQTVIVFPEGTTHRGDEVRSFRGGAFAALRGLDVELLPVGIAYRPGSEFVDESFGAHVARMAQRPSTPIALVAGEPQPAQGDRDAIADAMQREVQRLVTLARSQLQQRG